MYRTVLLGAIVVALAMIGSTAAQAPQPDLAGVYRCDGKNPDGSAYQGVVEISRVKETFRVVYKVDGDKLVGEWTMGGAEGAMYVETLTKTPGAQVPARPPSGGPPPRPRRQTPNPENGGGIQL
jgi:hypothetical protein